MEEKRWYDDKNILKEFIDCLEALDKDKRDQLLLRLRDLVMEYDGFYIEKNIGDLPLTLRKRRWYDHDPYAWIIINGLRYCNEQLMKEVIDLAKKTIKSK